VDVDSFVKQRIVCQQANHEKVHPASLLQPLPIPEGMWQDISMDFIGDYLSLMASTAYW
jgi:hypothetical protein